jgi:hypothetical protein
MNIYGDKHPEVVTDLNNLASLLEDQDNLASLLGDPVGEDQAWEDLWALGT